MMIKNIIVSILLSASVFIPIQAMEPEEPAVPKEPYKEVYESVKELSDLIMVNGVMVPFSLHNKGYSKAEVVMLRSETGMSNPVYLISVDSAYTCHVLNDKPHLTTQKAINEVQKKAIIEAKQYYDMLRQKIYDKTRPALSFEEFIPSTEELNREIPSFESLSILFEEFLRNNGNISTEKLLTLKKWMLFDCSDKVFCNLNIRKGGDRTILIQLSEQLLWDKKPGAYIIRPSATVIDDYDNHIFCRTITFVSTTMDEGAYPIIHYRIMHKVGEAFYLCNDIEKPETWFAYPSLISFLEYFRSGKFLNLPKYYRPVPVDGTYLLNDR